MKRKKAVKSVRLKNRERKTVLKEEGQIMKRKTGKKRRKKRVKKEIEK